MRATEFEQRHAFLFHQGIVLVAFLTYLLQRDDIVWRYIKDNPANRVQEHTLFAVATFLVGLGAILCTRARANDSVANGHGHSESLPSSNRENSRYWGELLYAFGLASLVPLTGFIILVLGEAIRIFRLKRRSDDLSPVGVAALEQTATPRFKWRHAFRREAIKWGIFIAMITFAITLNDRVADALIVSAWVVGLMLVKGLLPFALTKKMGLL